MPFREIKIKKTQEVQDVENKNLGMIKLERILEQTNISFFDLGNNFLGLTVCLM